MANKNALLLLGALLAVPLAGCLDGGDSPPAGDGAGPTGTLRQAGSSTILPIAEAWAEALAPEGIQVVVAGGGSGAGASKLCAKEIDIGDLSRAMKQSEIDACKAAGVDPVAWEVAFDGLTVVVSKENAFVDKLTVDELKHIWRAEAPARTWAEVRAGWPSSEIKLYGPDSDSGTYEFFNEEILGKTCGADGKQICGPRNDYTPSPDDNVLVEGVAASEDAIGHFGYAYFEDAQDRLKAVPIVASGATTAIAPSFETIADKSYKPLSRPLYMYTNGVPEAGSALHAYLEFALGDGQDLVRDAGYVELDQGTISEQAALL